MTTVATSARLFLGGKLQNLKMSTDFLRLVARCFFFWLDYSRTMELKRLHKRAKMQLTSSGSLYHFPFVMSCLSSIDLTQELRDAHGDARAGDHRHSLVSSMMVQRDKARPKPRSSLSCAGSTTKLAVALFVAGHRPFVMQLGYYASEISVLCVAVGGSTSVSRMSDLLRAESRELKHVPEQHFGSPIAPAVLGFSAKLANLICSATRAIAFGPTRAAWCTGMSSGFTDALVHVHALAVTNFEVVV
jgi:hypothetical protein